MLKFSVRSQYLCNVPKRQLEVHPVLPKALNYPRNSWISPFVVNDAMPFPEAMLYMHFNKERACGKMLICHSVGMHDFLLGFLPDDHLVLTQRKRSRQRQPGVPIVQQSYSQLFQALNAVK